jgi:hypothetical protein
MSNFNPTPEQAAAVEAAKTGENLVITACAGSGKTSTLRLIADALAPARGTYIAYNKAIQLDAAASFPSNVSCRTAHSLAFGAVGKHYMPRLKARRMTGRQLAQTLDIEDSFPLDQFGDNVLTPARLASLVMATVAKWTHTALDASRGSFIKAAGGVVFDVPGCEEVSHDLAKFLGEAAERAWRTDLCKTSGRLPFTHDMYVKIWALGGINGDTPPRIPGAFLLYDEAQDADPCIADVVLRQDAQLIAVGDESQAIYGWRGATDAMRDWPAQHRVALTKSFRFGPAVADEANVFLSALDAPLRVVGHDPIPSTVGEVEAPDAILCRTNGEVVAQALVAHDKGRTFAIVGGTAAIRKFAEAAESLMRGEPARWHADLGAFKRWADVVEYVKSGDGSDIGTLVRMVENYGADTLYEVCDNARDEGEADVVLSTAHKAKGREWDRVMIGGDFAPSEDRERAGLSRSEAMLMYVAVTRAKLALDASALTWARGMVVA